MNEDILVPMSFFLAVFGVVYLYLSTRNKERLALIEKGADASIFMKGGKTSFYKVILLNVALLLMGVGLGVFIAIFVTTYTALDKNAVYPAVIFLMAGLSLFIGFYMTKNLDK